MTSPHALPSAITKMLYFSLAAAVFVLSQCYC
jgi:hypothetical protein